MMTRYEILNMTAGREMDILVAEMVMGQTNFEHLGFYWTEGTTEDGQDGWEGIYCPRCGASEGSKDKCCIHYSTNIAAAWQVVEMLRSKLWGRIELVSGLEWHCWSDLDKAKSWGSGDTAPLAICRAALLAVIEGCG